MNLVSSNSISYCSPKKINVVYLLSSILLGTLIFFKPILFLLFLCLGVLGIFLIRVNSSERAILTKIVVIAICLRMLFSFVAILYFITADYGHKGGVLLRMLSSSGQLFRDFHREVLNGIHLSRYFLGEYGAVSLKEVEHAGVTSFLHLGAYFQAILNVVFGRSLLNILVFPIIAVSMVILVYYLAKEIFNRRVAILSAIILAVLPSFVIWSSTNIRTSLGIIAMLLIGLSLVKFVKNSSPKYLFYLAIGIIMINFAKDKMLRPLLFIIPFLIFLAIKINLRNKIKILIIALFFCIYKGNFINAKIQSLVVDFISRQKSFATYISGSNYKIYDDFFYSVDISDLGYISPFVFIKALPKATGYFLFSPFPWKITNELRLYAYPQIIFWYLFFPFSLIGIMIGLRFRFKMISVLLTWVFFWIVMFSLVMGNEGIAARQRDLILPFFYIFASVGITHLLGRKIFEN